MENKRTKVAWLWLRDVILPCLVLYILFFHIIGLVIVAGSSMEPNYSDGNILFINRLKKNSPQRCDVAVIDSIVATDEKRLIKRVIGLPGDTIDIAENGVVTINGEILEESYIIGKTDPGVVQSYPLLIPEGYIFVMGDNREYSNDSRSEIGLIPISDVVGIAFN